MSGSSAPSAATPPPGTAKPGSSTFEWPRVGPRTPAGLPGALYVEMQPPPPSVARSLRLTPGQIAAMVTVRFDDPANQEPVALTVAACRPDVFRIVISSDEQPFTDGNAGSFAGAWTHAVEGWEP